MDNIYRQFKDPDVSYRPAPFWIWNEEMDADETARQLEELKSHGFGGGFAHVRLGLITPYLGEEFFDVWGKTLEKAKKLGIKLYMYDEDGWPSGFAGGHVMNRHPETLKVYLTYRIENAEKAKKSDRFYSAYAFNEETNTVGECLKDIPQEKWQEYSDKIMLLETENPRPEQWCGGYPFVDLSNPKVTETFIETTYEEYFKRFGKDFGDAIPAVFSDESSINGMDDKRLIFTDVVRNKFYEMHGYRLEDNVTAVYEDFNGKYDYPPEKIRYDYNCTLSELWIESFVKPISKWCEEHKVAWTGHDQEHSWPQTRGGAFSEQRTYEFRQWPGIDMLLCDALSHDKAWNDTFLMYEVRSAANQFNKEKTICEAYGAAGWHSTFRDYKRIGDWLMVNGINFMIQHLTHYSIIGSRKRDCPQSFDWRQPWWDEYKDYNDYFSRISYILSQGKMQQRILLMNTSTTGYLLPASKQKGMINHTASPDCIKNPDMSDMLTVMQKLIDEQWDFDIGDEFSVADNGSADGKKLKIGAQSYDVVIVSKNMLNMRRETAELLKKFEKNGGIVLATGDAAQFISGSKDAELEKELKSGWTYVDGADGVHNALCGILPRRLTCSRDWPTGVAHMRRVLDDGREVYFFVNHTMEDFRADITLKGNSAAKWDLFNGEKSGIKCNRHNGNITFELALEYNQSAMIVVNDDAEINPAKPSANKEIKLAEVSIKPEKYNNLLLDHCALNVDGNYMEARYYLQTQNNLYNARGLGSNVWTSGVQFRSEFLDKNNFGEGSGFEVIYNVTVKDGALPSEIFAVIERPDLMNLRVNGIEAPWTGEKHYLDYKMGKIDIAKYMKEGENELVVWADRFDIRDEIECLILEGNFGVDIENERFVICTPNEKFTYGSWVDQKYRFYPNAFIYTYSAELDKKPESAKLVLGEYKASAVSVKVNGEYAGIVGKDGGPHAEIADYLKPGKNEIAIRVCASFRNLFGPHLEYIDQTVAVWESFATTKKVGINNASEYDLVGYGLYEAPKLFVNE